MTSSLLTPWWRDRAVPVPRTSEVAGSTEPTTILDWSAPSIVALAEELHTHTGRELLRNAHGLIGARVRAVYAVDDQQPASRTLLRGRGSCSQRLALLEAVARSAGIGTRARGLLVDGRFWYPRFPRMRILVPSAVVLAWPEFYLDGAWVPASEVFGPFRETEDAVPFTNADGETLFDAIARGAFDWDGATRSPQACSSCDLSAVVLRDLGYFTSRDDLFAAHGQTLCRPARTLADPVLSHRTAGA